MKNKNNKNWKQLEFDFINELKPKKQDNKRNKEFRKKRIRMREEETHEQLNFPFYDDNNL